MRTVWVEKQIPPLRYGMTNKKQQQKQMQQQILRCAQDDKKVSDGGARKIMRGRR
jgi:hypothetical protein